MYQTTIGDLRESCERHVPGISDLIENDMDYAEVMAKILCPGLFPDWDFSEVGILRHNFYSIFATLRNVLLMIILCVSRSLRKRQ